jgi:hypothetical protein
VDPQVCHVGRATQIQIRSRNSSLCLRPANHFKSGCQAREICAANVPSSHRLSQIF